ncbi:uncharacterized protein LOC134266247, partial [Saccostrea cucullata]|uniref:uncharacterized protein LOC134266247 n=1 Tax=Saccostrea cuccullata TaxID=36930 RepID=UPI002ED13612
MGHGVKNRTRECTNPSPCGVLASYCPGSNTSDAECEEFPPCLEGSVFGGNYMTKDDPLVLYSSANIEILPKTQITCVLPNLYKNWTLYLCDEHSENETLTYMAEASLFQIRPGAFPFGLYRLFVRIEYYPGSYEFVEGYMYFKLQLPPPNVIIQGGSGRMSGPGKTTLDAWSGSYDLTKGPGYRDGLKFSWSCLEFPTDSLEMLMTFVIPESFTFLANVTVSWDYIQSLAVMSETYLNLASQTNIMYFNNTYRYLNLTNITNPQSCEDYSAFTRKKNRIPNPCFLDNVMSAELYYLLQDFTSNNYIQEILAHREVAQRGYTDIKNGLPLLKLEPNITNQETDMIETEFLPSMKSLIRHLRIMTDVLTELNRLMYGFPKENFTISTLRDFDKHLVDLTTEAEIISSFNISDMMAWEAEAWNLVIKLFENSQCTSFSETTTGFAEVVTDPNHQTKAVGYIVSVKVTILDAENIYQQRIQIVFPNSSSITYSSDTFPDINIECLLNCKPKVATSLVMSLRAECITCSASDLAKIVYSWKLMEFDPTTRTTSKINDWEDWLETDPSEQKFFVKANSFRRLSYYMLTLRMNISDDRWAEIRMILETTEPPYDGYCRIDTTKDGKQLVVINAWKDEGFRKQKNKEIDWKEQISFRLFQEDSQTQEKTLLYQGNERYIEGIYFNYGHEEDNWLINTYAEVLDVFDDFTTCTFHPIAVYSPMMAMSVEDYLQNSQALIETAIEQEDVGLVSMAVETTISTTNRESLPPPSLIDTLVEDPGSWSSVGDNTTFENLFQELTYVPEDVNSTLELLTEGMKNMTNLLSTSTSSLRIDTTVRQRQMAFSSGSAMEKKQLVTKEVMATALNATNDVIGNFINTSKEAMFPVYEDYLSTSEAILRSVDNLLNVLIPKLSPDIPDTGDIDEIAKEYAASDLINSYDGTGFSPQERALFTSMSVASYREKLNSSVDMASRTVPSMQNSIVELGTVLKEITHRKQFEVEVTRPGLTTSMEKLRVDQEIDRKDLKIKLDVSNTKQDFLQVTKYSKTPFIWDSEAKNIQSPTVHIVLGDQTKLPSIKTKFSVSPSVTKRDVVLAFPDDPEESSSQTFSYKIWWRNPLDNLVFSVECDNSTMNTTSHVVYVKKDSIPTAGNHGWSKVIVPSDWTDVGFSCLLPMNFCPGPCLIYFSVHVASIPKPRTSRRRRSAYNGTSTATYRISGWTTGCRVWDGGKWDKTSCQLTSETNGKETVCECKNPPGDNFATSFFVPPNSIDFSTVFDKFDILGNGAVFGTVTAIIVLYLIGLLIARRYDKKDQEKWKLLYMNDNLKTDKFVYLVTVYTGLSRNSGTKSNVSFVMTSHLRDTGVRHLTDGVKKGFETGSVCT